MNPLKIAAIAVVLGVVLIISIVAAPFSFERQTPAEESTETPAKKQTENSFKNPLVWLEESIQAEQKILPSQTINNALNALNSISEIIDENSAPSALTQTGLNPPYNKDDYLIAFSNLGMKIGFSGEELALMKKNKDGRIFLLGELIEQAKSGTGLEELRASFSAWRRFDEKVLTELNTLSKDYKDFSAHQLIVGWSEYNSSIAKKFSEENLSSEEISQLAREFKKRGELHNLNLQQSLISVRGLKNVFSVFIPEAQAVTCLSFVPPGFYNFGGRILVPIPCDYGLILPISIPCGGLVFFSYVAMATTYLWHIYLTSNAILGKALAVPGMCGLGACSPPPSCSPSSKCVCFPYEFTATIIHGTSLK